MKGLLRRRLPPRFPSSLGCGSDGGPGFVLVHAAEELQWRDVARVRLRRMAGDAEFLHLRPSACIDPEVFVIRVGRMRVMTGRAFKSPVLKELGGHMRHF